MSPLFREVAAAGHHEVIVEGPVHGRRMADMGDLQVADVVEANHSRYLALRADPRVAYVIALQEFWRPLGRLAGLPPLPDRGDSDGPSACSAAMHAHANTTRRPGTASTATS